MVDNCEVQLVQRYSHARCIANVSFGCSQESRGPPSSYWVSNGCRGEFVSAKGAKLMCGVTQQSSQNCTVWPPVWDDINGTALRAREVALSFDDAGSSVVQRKLISRGRNSSTTAILDALDRLGVSAGFFVNAVVDPVLLAAMAARGHIVGSHADRHWPPMPLIENLTTAVAVVERVFRKVIGEPPVMFRAPFGQIDWRVLDFLHARQYLHVGWTGNAHDVDFSDRKDADEKGPQMALASWESMLLLHNTSRKHGLLALLHDTTWTAQVLPQMATVAHRLGFRIVSFDKVLETPQLQWARQAAGCLTKNAHTVSRPTAIWCRDRALTRPSGRHTDNTYIRVFAAAARGRVAQS